MLPGFCGLSNFFATSLLIPTRESLPMFIPYGTDSPIYHWPFATIGLMVVNIFVLVFQSMSPGFEDLGVLSHGDGLHPIQWILSFFMHAGIGHLIGNMIFLWTFGMIVEGKAGPWLFLLLYMSMGVFQNVVEQVLFLGASPGGGSLGASSAIFGLMMIALLWAPQDNIKMLFNPILFYVFFFHVPVAMVGLLYFLWDFTVAFFSGFEMGTSLLHLMGAITGLGFGLALLKLSWVDCEQRDMISMFRELIGKEPIKKKKTKAELKEEAETRESKLEERKKKLVIYGRSVTAHIAAGKPDAASKTFRQIKRLNPNARWQDSELYQLILLYQKQSNWDQVIRISHEYLESYDGQTANVGLNLAKVILLEKDSPRKAIEALRKIKDPSSLSPKQKKIFQAIVKKANQLIAEGAIELGDID